MNILIAEDDAVTRKLLRAQLQSLGHSVTVTHDGEEAWARFQDTSPRLVVSDWMMPNMDGLELCQRIRAREDEDYTFFILLTAISDQESNYQKAIESGVDDFLPKPMNKRQLVGRLRVAQRILYSTSRINTMDKMLTMCAYTKKINAPEEGGWQTVEEYMSRRLGVSISHGIEPSYYENVIKPQLQQMKAG